MNIIKGSNDNNITEDKGRDEKTKSNIVLKKCWTLLNNHVKCIHE